MKIYIVGIVASGKTTLAKGLSEKIKIPRFELDSIIHDDENNGQKRSLEEQLQIIYEINKKEDWIIEGTHRKNLDELFILADKIIYLDIPLYKRRLRILKRYIKQKIRLEKCSYNSNIEMLKMMYKWTNDFEKNKHEFEGKLSKYKNKLVRSNSNNINIILQELDI